MMPDRNIDELIARTIFGCTFEDLPRYSRDVGAAFDVVRALKTPTVFFELYSGVANPANRYEPSLAWTCRFVQHGACLGYGTADKPALAICIAALRTRGIELEAQHAS